MYQLLTAILFKCLSLSQGVCAAQFQCTISNDGGRKNLVSVECVPVFTWLEPREGRVPEVCESVYWE